MTFHFYKRIYDANKFKQSNAIVFFVRLKHINTQVSSLFTK